METQVKLAFKALSFQLRALAFEAAEQTTPGQRRCVFTLVHRIGKPRAAVRHVVFPAVKSIADSCVWTVMMHWLDGRSCVTDMYANCMQVWHVWHYNNICLYDMTIWFMLSYWVRINALMHQVQVQYCFLCLIRDSIFVFRPCTTCINPVFLRCGQ